MDAPIINHDQHSVTMSYKGACSNKYVMGLRYAWQESPCNFKKCAVYITENEMPMAPLLEFGLIGGNINKPVYILQYGKLVHVYGKK